MYLLFVTFSNLIISNSHLCSPSSALCISGGAWRECSDKDGPCPESLWIKLCPKRSMNEKINETIKQLKGPVDREIWKA